MLQITKILIGIVILALGFPIGNWIYKATKEEVIKGQKWIKALTLLGLAGGILGLILGNDFILFSSFFVSIVCSRSIKEPRIKRK